MRRVLQMNDPKNTQFVDPSKFRTNIVCNDFNMREVILEILKGWKGVGTMDDLADDIQEAFKIKLGLVQG